jgi:hypothetical protein
MAGLDPAIHVFPLCQKQDVDARDERGHDQALASQNHTPDDASRTQVIERG